MRDEIQDFEWVEFELMFAEFGFIQENALLTLRKDLSLFLNELLAANERINLTAVRDFRTGVWKHLFDSLLLVSCEPMGSVLDWGTGGGLPGIPLALFRRAFSISSPVVLLDSVKKKANCVEKLCSKLTLDGCEVFGERGEALLRSRRFDSVVMRAVAPPEKAISWVSPEVANFFFMTGPAQVLSWRESEVAMRGRGFLLDRILRRDLPREMGERYIVCFRRA